jgi:hypothetical protein
MKITRRELRRIILEAVDEYTVTLANAALGYLQMYLADRSGDVRQRAKRAQGYIPVMAEFDGMRSNGDRVTSDLAKYVQKKMEKLREEDLTKFNNYADIGKDVKVK